MKIHSLKADKNTVKWGYYDNTWDPVLTVKSGDFIDVEALNHQSGDAVDYLFDDIIREIYEYNKGRDMGDHLITGPIYLEDAAPGDVVEMKIISMEPRMNYGSNVLANWGNLSNQFDRKETVFIYEVDPIEKVTYPIYKYKYPRPINGPGLVVDESKITKEFIDEKLTIPLNLHFGVAGVLPAEKGKIHTLHPKKFGGNVDNKNFVEGTSMYFKVEIPGAGVYVGDSHFAQGDGELSGTAIEGSVNGRIQLILHKDKKLFKNQILDSPNYWDTHGYGHTLDLAIQEAAMEAIDFISHRYNISKELAYSILSVKADFHITQVANGIKGIHCRIPKNIFSKLKESSESI